MSRKSRPPKPGKKAKKGKKGASVDSRVVEEVVVETVGPPFGLVVLIALVLTIPSLMSFMDGDMTFQSTAMRFLGALAVSWLLVQLVYSVITSFETEETTTVVTETPPPDYSADQYRTSVPDQSDLDEPRP